MKKIFILNTGGTFNKIYNPLNGKLEVAKNNEAIKNILKYQNNLNYDIKAIISKDSLDINDDDRSLMLKEIQDSDCKKIIIVHGTDTIDKTAIFLEERIKNKIIVLTGAMVPFSIRQIEATSNFSIAVGFLFSNHKKGIYISMQGMVELHHKVFKNRKIGVFQKFNQ